MQEQMEKKAQNIRREMEKGTEKDCELCIITVGLGYMF